MRPETRTRSGGAGGSGAGGGGGDRIGTTTGSFRPPMKPPPAPTSPPTEAASAHPTDFGPAYFIRKMTAAEFNTALIHYYRGEIQRSNTWRNRLDTTTNWAVITAGATLSFAFTDANNPHFVILINTVLVAFFLFMEARRYRYYEIWSSRVRVIETGYFANLLAPGSNSAPDREWAERLAKDLLTPHFTISEWEALGRRLRRNYLWIFVLLAASWNLKVYLHPWPAADFDEFIRRSAVGVVPGSIVLIIGIIFNTVIMVVALATVRLKEAQGEVLSQIDFSLPSFREMTSTFTNRGRHRATVRRAKRARERTRTTAASSSGANPTGTTGEWKKLEKEVINR